ncbi:anti-sigma factor family protein [Candidatus Palauibacter sp.]|uniref:anti-sigma factor family protein n=1 Tax=Candidatus Palauibacter sp. TaxID=3101350 RepID=UPI003B012F04
MESDAHEVHIDDRTLNRFADGGLTERASDAVRLHLGSCAACRREVQLIRALSAAIRAVPTPKPPDELFGELFPEAPKTPSVIPLAAPQRKLASFSRGLVLSGAAFLMALIAAVVVWTVGPDRVMAGSSTLSLHWEDPAALTLEYETISPLGAEPGVRARLRYWVPDSLRFAQTEPGYGVVELSREEPGVFSGTVDLPPGTVYAVAAVENLDGSYIDSDFGRFWEYLETDARGQPTLQARRYQMLATSELSLARAAAVAEEAASQFPEQPEFWVPQLLFAQSASPPASRGAFLQEHAARLNALDRAAREGIRDRWNWTLSIATRRSSTGRTWRTIGRISWSPGTHGTVRLPWCTCNRSRVPRHEWEEAGASRGKLGRDRSADHRPGRAPVLDRARRSRPDQEMAGSACAELGVSGP